MSATPSLEIGIVIPNYNHRRYVEAAIESALAQSWPHFRVVVVDDGSTDGSAEVIQSYRDRVEVVIQANQGQTAACLAGWRRLGTPVVMFLDSDDLLAPGAAAAVAAAWAPGVIKVQWAMEVIDSDTRPSGTVFPKYPLAMSTAVLRRELLRTGLYPSPPTSGNAYSSDLVQTMTGRSPLRFIDSMLNVAAPLHGEVVTLRDCLGSYRIHGSNAWLMSSLSVTRLRSRMADEIARTRFLAGLCAERGLEFDSDRALSMMLSHQEHRLALARLGDRPPGLISVLWQNLVAIAASEHGARHKLLRAAWALLVAILPRAAAESLLLQRMTPTSRSPAMERILRRLLGSPPTAGTTATREAA